MKHMTVKVRLTVCLTLLMGLLAALLLGFMLSISSSVTLQAAMTQLEQAVRSELSYVSVEDGSLVLDDGFTFYSGGVYILVYSQSEALLAGQVPVSFTTSEPFENGEIRVSGDYLVLDLWVASGWDDGVWLRGLMQVPEQGQTAQNLLRMAALALPAFLLLTILGCYWITRRSFRPLDRIIAAASAINDSRDLAARIELPPGRDEFTRLAGAFNEMLERLEASFETEKRFTSDVSHELRTPVSVIKGACEYAEKYDETPEDRQETITMIHRQADKMSALIEQMLQMTRLEQGMELASLTACDLGELTQSVCSEQPYGADRLLVSVQPGLTAQADPALLGRLLQNLIENGFRYGKPDGHVWVTLARQDSEICLSVRDDGIGIPQEQQEAVWTRFYQADPSRGSGGAGLGLAMVRQIAQAHGGYMTLESVPEVGSVFTLHLPDAS